MYYFCAHSDLVRAKHRATLWTSPYKNSSLAEKKARTCLQLDTVASHRHNSWILLQYAPPPTCFLSLKIFSFLDYKNFISKAGVPGASPNAAHFACLLCLTHPVQVLELLLMSWWTESGVIDKGDMQNVQYWGGSRNEFGNHWSKA